MIITTETSIANAWRLKNPAFLPGEIGRHGRRKGSAADGWSGVRIQNSRVAVGGHSDPNI